MALTQVPSGMMASGGVPSFDGIKFPASQVSSADANTLDDYEEGTWTPFFTGATSNPTVTYITQAGRYVKVGRMVTCWAHLYISGSTGGSGNIQISGLPFTSSNNSSMNWYGNSTIGYFSSLAGASTYNDLKLLGPQSANTMVRFHEFNSKGVAGPTDVTTLQSGVDMYVGFSYEVD